MYVNILLQLTNIHTVRTACTTSRERGLYGIISCCISRCPVYYSVKFDTDIFIQSGVRHFSFHITEKSKMAAAAILDFQVM